MFDQGNDYVRCILIDYSKAFNVVNHEILLTELSDLGLNNSIFSWIANFLTGRFLSVKIGDVKSAFLLITRSIVHGSGLGPYLFILLARRLKSLSLMNHLVKYVDETTLVVPQRTDCSIEVELQNINNWSHLNKLIINKSETKEIIFWKSGKVKNSQYTNHSSNWKSSAGPTFGSYIAVEFIIHTPHWLCSCRCFPEILFIKSTEKISLATSGFNSVSDSRLFKNIKFDQHCLHHLLPQVDEVPLFSPAPNSLFLCIQHSC